MTPGVVPGRQREWFLLVAAATFLAGAVLGVAGPGPGGRVVAEAVAHPPGDARVADVAAGPGTEDGQFRRVVSRAADGADRVVVDLGPRDYDRVHAALSAFPAAGRTDDGGTWYLRANGTVVRVTLRRG